MNNSMILNAVDVEKKYTPMKNLAVRRQSIEKINKIQDASFHKDNGVKKNNKKDNLKEVLNDDLFKILGYLKSQERLA